MTATTSERDTHTNTCRECGKSYAARTARSEFCSTSCRKTNSNRRALRGAALYDLFMTLRYERDRAKDQKVWGIMCRLAEKYRLEDLQQREGRDSWRDFLAVIGDHVYLRAQRLLGPHTLKRR